MNKEHVEYTIDAAALDKVVMEMIDELIANKNLVAEKTLVGSEGESGKVVVKGYAFVPIFDVVMEGLCVTFNPHLKYGGLEILSNRDHAGNVKFHKCTIRGEIKSLSRSLDCSKIANLVFDECDMEAFEFHNMDFLMSAFQACNLTHTSFESCTLGHGTKFLECVYSHTEFDGCDLVGTTFSFKCEQGGYAFNEELSEEFNVTFYGCTWKRVSGLKVVEVSNFGTYRGSAVFLPELDKVYAGCWNGTFDSFVDQCVDILFDNADVIVNDELCDKVRPQYLGAIRYFATFYGEYASETLKYAESHEAFKRITGGGM